MVVAVLNDRETPWRAARRGVVVFLLVAVPVVFDPYSSGGFRLPKLLVVIGGASVILVLWLCEPSPQRRSILPLRSVGGALGVWLLWMCVSALSSRSPRTSLLGTQTSYNGVLTAATLIVVFAACAEAFDKATARAALLALWFGGGGITLLYGALQLHDLLFAGPRWDPVAWDAGFGDTLWSTIGSPTTMSGFFAILMPVGIVLFATSRRARLRVVVAAQLALLAVELIVASTRGAWLAALAALFVLGAFFRDTLRRRMAASALVAGGIVVVLVGAGLLLEQSGRTRYDIAQLTSTGTDTSAAQRLELWRAAADIARDHLVFGVGPDGFEAAFEREHRREFASRYSTGNVATDAHNVLLTRLAEGGLPGLIAWIGVLVAAGWCLARRAHLPGESRAMLAATLAGIVAWGVHSMFGRQHIILDFCFWSLLGLAIAVERPSTPRPHSRR